MAIKLLSKSEKGQILAYNDCKLSFYDIPKKMNHHRSSIKFFSIKIIRKLKLTIRKKVVAVKEKRSLHLKIICKTKQKSTDITPQLKFEILFILRPTTGQVGHNAPFKVGPDAGLQPTRVRHNPKIPSVPSASLKGGAPGVKKQTTNNW